MRTACLACDLLVDVAEVRSGQRANCPRCGHLLTSRTPNAHGRSLALSIAAVAFLSLANAFPFIELRSGGLTQVMTLPRSALELHQEGDTLIALLVFAPIVAIPGAILLVLALLLWALRQRRPDPWLGAAGRLFFMLSPWSMVEVFLIGVLVSLVKLGAMANVVLGVSFWSYVGFATSFVAALSSIDRLEVWSEIEEVVS